ncbi:monovalent cation:H+ antiporter, CPA1 (nhx1) [Quaeritorhiza haematococci]|nr:monovalent cation:H+ antiporter, CPA1 (nhx1) [Quaeritorhiza haematococci]
MNVTPRFLVYLVVLTGLHSLHTSFGLMDCMVFGAILSSTDPVTVLAIFHQLRVDPKLYAIIFGESILNDSVAIVLTGTLKQFGGKDVSFSNMTHGIGIFLGVFFGSLLIGTILALICALMLKHSHLHEYPSLESCLISLLAYSSYLLSNAIQLSGIVSLLFCGITLKHYAYDNMSVRSRRTTKYMFRVLSQLSENFVFIYLGVTLFTKADEVYLPGLIIFTLIAIMIARYVSTIPLAHLINWINMRLYHREEAIPRNHQLMLWWAGLRGAIAFALSFDVTGPAGPAIRTTTLVVCVVSIMLLGGTTNHALVRLKIRTGVGAKDAPREDDDDPEDTDSSEDEVEDWDDELPGATRRGISVGGRFYTDDNESLDSREDLDDAERRIMINSTRIRSPMDDDMTHWFISFDTRWVKPLFTRSRFKWGRTGQSARNSVVPASPRDSLSSRGSQRPGSGSGQGNSDGHAGGGGRARIAGPGGGWWQGNSRGPGIRPNAFGSTTPGGASISLTRTGSGGPHGSITTGGQRQSAAAAATAALTGRLKAGVSSMLGNDASKGGGAGMGMGGLVTKFGRGGRSVPPYEDDEVFQDVDGNVWTANRPQPGAGAANSGGIPRVARSKSPPIARGGAAGIGAGTTNLELSGMSAAGSGIGGSSAAAVDDGSSGQQLRPGGGETRGAGPVDIFSLE